MIGGLGFLNATLLLGGLAAALPVLIHLLSKRRRQRVEWGAMFLLDQIVREDRRRIELRQWILLLLRALIVLCLALLMARPILTGGIIPAGDSPTTAVLILDDSYSMAAADGEYGSTSFDRAVALAKAVEQVLPENSRVTVLSATTGDTIDLRHNESLSPRPMIADLDAALSGAMDILRESQDGRQDVMVISDFQSIPTQAQGDAFVTFLPIAHAAQPQNVAVLDLKLEDEIPLRHQQLSLLTTIQNTGEADLTDVRVRLRSDNQIRDEQTIRLRAGAVVRVPLTLPATDAASVRVMLEIEHYQDQLPDDDVFHLGINARENIRVLVVTDETGAPFGDNAFDFISLALSPGGPDGPFTTSTVAADELTSRTLEDVDVVVLADVSAVDSPAMTALWDYVRGGGGLMIFAGSRFDPTAWSEQPLPATPVEQVDAVASPALPPYASAALSAWNRESDPSLSTVRLTRRWSLRLHPRASSLLQSAAADTLIAENMVGRGRIAFAAFPADGTWSDLPLRAAFVPLVQGLARHVTRTRDKGSAIVGQPYLVASDARTLSSPRVLDPNGRAVRLQAEDGDITFTPDVPGVYTLVDGDRVLAAVGANADRSESLNAAALSETVRQATEAAVATTVGELQQLEAERRVGREVWTPLLIALLALLIGELLLGDWFGREVAA